MSNDLTASGSCTAALTSVIAFAVVMLPFTGAAEAPLSASTPGVKLEVLGLDLREHYGEVEPAEGHQFLVLDIRFTNVIGVDLVFRHDVPERVELASLRRKVFLHWGGKRVCTLDEDRQKVRDHLPDDIVLRRHGAKVRGELTFEVPAGTLPPTTLHYYHDSFGPLTVALKPPREDEPSAPAGAVANQALRLAVTKFEERREWEGVSAPPGRTFAVVHLTGEGGFAWTTRAVMLDADADDPEREVPFRLPFEFFDARLSLNIVADGEVAIPYDPALSEGGDDLTFLPGRWSEYVLVYPVPEDHRSLALEALFGRMGLGYEKGEVLDPLRFPLKGEPQIVPPPPDAIHFADENDGYRFELDVSDLKKSAAAHGVDPEPGESFLSLVVRVHYDGPDPGRDSIHRRFFFLLPGGLPRQPDPATFAGGYPPLRNLSFAPGTRRRFELVFAVPTDLDRTTLTFSGPGQVHQIPLVLTPEGARAAGPVVRLNSLELESRALLKRGEDGHVTAADELASDVRRPRPENIKPEWAKKWTVDRGGHAAEIVVRVGDIDNFGFGWPDGYDPFSGEPLKSHPYPWLPDPRDPPGTDRIMVVSSYAGRGTFDGYTSGTRRPFNKVQDIVFSFAADDLQITSATLQMFLDDFQSKKVGSRFQFALDGVLLPSIEDVINSLNQTGPVGKLVTVAIPKEALHLLEDGEVALRFDDPTTGAGDGFAVDFVQLSINPRPAGATGTVRGTVVDDATGHPLAGALVSAAGLVDHESADDGSFSLEMVTAGHAVVSASKPGYRTATLSGDLNPDGSLDLEFRLKKESAGDTLKAEGHVVVRGIRFDTGSATLQPESEEVLQDLLGALRENQGSRFRVEGHTDSQGSDAYNLTLSEKRAAAVVDWFRRNGIPAGRLQSEGFGKGRPVASNESETGRALNRRVEILELKP